MESVVRLLSQEQPLSVASTCGIAQVLSHLGSGAEIALQFFEAALSGGAAVDPSTFPPIWDAWNAKNPAQQAADCLPADNAYISRLEKLSDAELAAITLDFFGMKLDAAGLVRVRLGEHAVHTWDVAVAIDPAAVVAPDAVALLHGFLPWIAQRVGKPAGETFRARLAGHFPDVDFLLEVADAVTLAPWPEDGAGEPLAGKLRLPTEALLRLVYGRLDPAHTPPAEVSGDGALLDRARAAFPGL